MPSPTKSVVRPGSFLRLALDLSRLSGDDRPESHEPANNPRFTEITGHQAELARIASTHAASNARVMQPREFFTEDQILALADQIRAARARRP